MDRSEIMRRLGELFDKTAIVDSHEHLAPESVRLKSEVSFTDLFWHYCQEDFAAAGMPDVQRALMYANTTPLEDKYALFAEFYPHIRSGGYARAARISMQRFYGVKDICCLDDARRVTEKMLEANKPGLYNAILIDACHLQTCLTFSNETYTDPMFRPVWGLDDIVSIVGTGDIEQLRLTPQGIPASLEDFCDAVTDKIGRLQARGVVGLKLAIAYQRDLDFKTPAFAPADALYNRILEESVGRSSGALGHREARPLHNYLVHKVVEQAGKLGLVMVFHTGIQSGNYNQMENSRPEKLWSLVNRYRDTRFVLLHMGLPWVEEAILLAKYFPNVHLDLAWVHIISPQIAQTAIKTYIDLAPRNKLLGFGGDFIVAENVYGHLMLCRENITCALADCVVQGKLTEEEAAGWQDAMLVENPKRIYAL